MINSEDSKKEVVINDISDDDVVFFEELNDDIEEFEVPKEKDMTPDKSIFEKNESPFKKNTQVIIKESTEIAAEKLLVAFNETIANVVGAFSDIDKNLLLPEKDKVKDLSKELAILLPQLHIGKGTGLMMAVTSCYVPVATNIIIEVKKNKNNEASKTFNVVRSSRYREDNIDKTDNSKD